MRITPLRFATSTDVNNFGHPTYHVYTKWFLLQFFDPMNKPSRDASISFELDEGLVESFLSSE